MTKPTTASNLPTDAASAAHTGQTAKINPSSKTLAPPSVTQTPNPHHPCQQRLDHTVYQTMTGKDPAPYIDQATLGLKGVSSLPVYRWDQPDRTYSLSRTVKCKQIYLSAGPTKHEPSQPTGRERSKTLGKELAEVHLERIGVWNGLLVLCFGDEFCSIGKPYTVHAKSM